MASTDRDYRLSPRAEEDVEGIYDYTVRTWSARQADAYLHELTVAFEGLASGSRIGRIVPTRRGVMKLPVGSHIIFYTADQSHIDLIRVLHQAMDVPSHL